MRQIEERRSGWAESLTEWIADADDGGSWIGCTEKGVLVYKDDRLKSAWEGDVRGVARKAKAVLRDWAASKKYLAEMLAGDPKAFGGEACKDKVIESAAAQAAFFKAKAAQAVAEARTA